MNFPRKVIALTALALMVAATGCGWATPASKKNTMTGVSESGYPKGQPVDAESPAIASQHRKSAETAENKAPEAK